MVALSKFDLSASTLRRTCSLSRHHFASMQRDDFSLPLPRRRCIAHLCNAVPPYQKQSDARVDSVELRPWCKKRSFFGHYSLLLTIPKDALHANESEGVTPTASLRVLDRTPLFGSKSMLFHVFSQHCGFDHCERQLRRLQQEHRTSSMIWRPSFVREAVVRER